MGLWDCLCTVTESTLIICRSELLGENRRHGAWKTADVFAMFRTALLFHAEETISLQRSGTSKNRKCIPMKMRSHYMSPHEREEHIYDI